MSSRLDWVPGYHSFHMSINQKSGRQTFRRRFVSGSLFVSPWPAECYLQIETKIEPDLRSLSLKNVLFTQEPMGSWFTLFEQLFQLLLYMRLFTAPTGKKDLLLLFFGASSGITFWHDKKDQGRYTTSALLVKQISALQLAFLQLNEKEKRFFNKRS